MKQLILKKILLKILTISGISFAVILPALVIFYFWASSGSYPREKYTEVVTYKTLNNKTLNNKTSNNKTSGTTDNDNVFTVVTYNIGYLSGLTNNQAINTNQQLFDNNLETVIKALKPFQPDFIGFQEIDIDSKRSFNVNQVNEIGEALNFPQGAIAINWDKNYLPFPYFPFSAHFGRILSGQAVLSRYPINSNERIVLENITNKPFFYKAFYIDRVAQITKIDIKGRSLILINVHLEAFDVSTRKKQTEFLQKLLSKYVNEYPVLLIGDFNSSLINGENPQPTINLLLNNPSLKSVVPREQLTDEKSTTFPSDKPIAKLDYIFYTPKTIEIVEWQIISEAKQASDHLPLMMKFRFR